VLDERGADGLDRVGRRERRRHVASREDRNAQVDDSSRARAYAMVARCGLPRARYASAVNPNARTVIDVGAEEGRGISTDAKGKVIDFAVNERCAAGAGTFTEAMARAIEAKLEDMGDLSLRSTQEVPLNAQCAVFAESEVVSLVHAKTSKEDIARAIHDGISNRIAAMARRVGVQNDIVLIGGVAKNKGFVASLKRQLEAEIKTPDEPEYVGALGAAVIAAS